MRTESLFDLTQHAWNHTAALLLRPFRWSVWLKLLLIAMVAGQLSAGGCNGFNGNVNLPGGSKQGTETPRETADAPSDEPLDAEEAGETTLTYMEIEEGLDGIGAWMRRFSVLVLLGLLLLIGLQVLMSWLAARFAFIFVDAVATGRVRIAEPFKRLGPVADSYFLWLIGLTVVVWVVTLGMLWAGASRVLSAYAQTPELPLTEFFFQHLWVIIGSILGLLTLFLIFSLLSAIVAVWSVDFIVPLMSQRRCGVLSAWREFLSIVRRAPGDAILYLLWRLLLGIVIGVAYAVVMFLLIIASVLILGLVALVGAALGAVVPFLKWPLIAIGVIMAVVWILALILATCMAMVPPATLIRTFSLRYLQSLNLGHQFFPATEAGTAPR